MPAPGAAKRSPAIGGFWGLCRRPLRGTWRRGADNLCVPSPTPSRSHGRRDPPYSEQTDIQRDITEMVQEFVDEQIIPNAEDFDHED